ALGLAGAVAWRATLLHPCRTGVSAEAGGRSSRGTVATGAWADRVRARGGARQGGRAGGRAGVGGGGGAVGRPGPAAGGRCVRGVTSCPAASRVGSIRCSSWTRSTAGGQWWT